MIAHLRGKLIAKQPGQAIVECGGVGYDVTISVPAFTGLPGVGAEASLHIYTQVSDDAIALFGFQSGAALSTVVGVLVEVPVMLSVVQIVRRSRGWYEQGRGV